MSKTYATESMHLNQYREGQVKEALGRWEREDPSMTYSEFLERTRCMARAARKNEAMYVEIGKLHREYPHYADRMQEEAKLIEKYYPKAVALLRKSRGGLTDAGLMHAFNISLHAAHVLMKKMIKNGDAVSSEQKRKGSTHA